MRRFSSLCAALLLVSAIAVRADDGTMNPDAKPTPTPDTNQSAATVAPDDASLIAGVLTYLQLIGVIR